MSERTADTDTRRAPRRTANDAPAWIALFLVVVAIVAVGYYAFFTPPRPVRSALPLSAPTSTPTPPQPTASASPVVTRP